MSEAIETRVIECVMRHCGDNPEPIEPETALRDLEIESIDFVEIIFDLEEAFDIDIEYNANEAETIVTVRDLAAKVVEMVEKQSAGKVDAG